MEPMRVLGIDPGGKRLGLALGDEATGFASPLEVAAYGGVDQTARKIAAVMETYEAELVVVGLPTRSDGAETPGCARSHALAAALAELGIAVALQSEYLTSNEARRRARSSGRRADQPVDDIAAQIILEGFFETGASGGTSP